MKNEEEVLKMAIIAGAASAIKYKEKKPMASEGEIMRHISKNIREILEKINSEF